MKWLGVATRNLRAGLLIGGACAVCCGAPVAAQSIDELYAKAKAEKTLVLWGAGPTASYERAAQAFERQFPGVSVSLTGGASNVLNAKIEEQVHAKKVEADVVIFQTIQDFMKWDKRGLLMHFRPEGFDKIAATAKDKNGAWIAVNAIPLFYVYNTEKVQPTEVPKSALDFLKPQFKGKLITVYPSDDDAALYAFYNVVQKYGWSYMDRYMAQEPKFIQGHLGVARSVASGESLVALEDSMTGAISVVRSGGKIALTAPAVDALPIFFTAEAILKDAPHPNAAKLFVSWYLSKDWQSKLGIYSSRNDVPPPEGMRPLSAYRLVNDYRRFVSDEKRLAELRKRFEKYTGPVPKAGAIVR